MKADGLLPLAAHRYYAEAEKALMQMDGMILGSQRIHCNWAKDKHETLSLSHGAVHRVTPFWFTPGFGDKTPVPKCCELAGYGAQYLRCVASRRIQKTWMFT